MTHRGRFVVMAILVAGLVLPAGTALGDVGSQSSYSLLAKIEQIVVRLQGWVQKIGAHMEPGGLLDRAGAQPASNDERADAQAKIGAHMEPNG